MEELSHGRNVELLVEALRYSSVTELILCCNYLNPCREPTRFCEAFKCLIKHVVVCRHSTGPLEHRINRLELRLYDDYLDIQALCIQLQGCSNIKSLSLDMSGASVDMMTRAIQAVGASTSIVDFQFSLSGSLPAEESTLISLQNAMETFLEQQISDGSKRHRIKSLGLEITIGSPCLHGLLAKYLPRMNSLLSLTVNWLRGHDMKFLWDSVHSNTSILQHNMTVVELVSISTFERECRRYKNHKDIGGGKYPGTSSTESLWIIRQRLGVVAARNQHNACFQVVEEELSKEEPHWGLFPTALYALRENKELTMKCLVLLVSCDALSVR